MSKRKIHSTPTSFPYTKLTQMDQRPNCKSYTEVYLSDTDLATDS